MLRLHSPSEKSDPLPAADVASAADALQPPPPAEAIRQAVWVDLAYPTVAEMQAVE